MVDSFVRIPRFLRPKSLERLIALLGYQESSDLFLLRRQKKKVSPKRKLDSRKRGHPSSLRNYHPVGEAWVVEIVCGGGVGSQEVRGYGGGIGFGVSCGNGGGFGEVRVWSSTLSNVAPLHLRFKPIVKPNSTLLIFSLP